MQEALEAQWLLFKPNSWKAQALGKGGPVLLAARFRTQAERREQNKRQGQRPGLLAAPPPPPLPHTKFRKPGEGGMYHEPRWRGKGSCGVASPSPSSYTCLSWAQAPAPSPWARPSSVRTSASCRQVVHPRGSGSCARKGRPRRSKLLRRWGPWASRLSRGDDSVVSGDPGSRKKLVLLLCCQ